MTLELCETCYSYGMLMINGSPVGLWCALILFSCLKEDNEVFLQMLTEASSQAAEQHGTKPKAVFLFNGRQGGQTWVERRWELPPVEVKWELASRKVVGQKKPWKWRQIIYIWCVRRGQCNIFCFLHCRQNTMTQSGKSEGPSLLLRTAHKSRTEAQECTAVVANSFSFLENGR